MISIFANRPEIGYSADTFADCGDTVVLLNRTDAMPFLHLLRGKRVIWACRWSKIKNRYPGFDDDDFAAMFELNPEIWKVDHRDPPSRGNRISVVSKDLKSKTEIDNLSWLPEDLSRRPCGCTTGFIVTMYLHRIHPDEVIELVGFSGVQPGSANIHSMRTEHELLYATPNIRARAGRRESDRYSFRAAACYTPYLEREQRLMGELDRVGLTATPFWQIPNPYDEVTMRGLRLTKVTWYRGHFSCSSNHYRMAKTALTLGASGFLGFEDDISFLKDPAKIREIMDALPSDADVGLFEWRTNRKHSEANRAEIAKAPHGALWHRCDNMRLVGCGMYYLSQKGLAWYVRCMERAAHDPKAKFLPSDGYWRPEGYDNEVIPYCATIRTCVQDSYTDCNSHNPEHVWEEYSLCNPIDPNLYNLRG